jgi:hypothetical protein
MTGSTDLKSFVLNIPPWLKKLATCKDSIPAYLSPKGISLYHTDDCISIVSLAYLAALPCGDYTVNYFDCNCPIFITDNAISIDQILNQDYLYVIMPIRV